MSLVQAHRTCTPSPCPAPSGFIAGSARNRNQRAEGARGLGAGSRTVSALCGLCGFQQVAPLLWA